MRALIQKLRDSLEEMSTLMRQIDQSHIRYRKRAVQRAQFLLLSDRSSQGSVTALLRRYAEEIKTPDQLFAPDDGRWQSACTSTRRRCSGQSPSTRPPRPAAKRRWPRCGRPGWMRSSCTKNSNCCWITPGWP